MTTSSKIIRIVENQLDRNDINMTTDIVDETQADSLDMIEIIMDVEQWFEMEIKDEDIELLRTPGDIVHYVEQNT
jgi:acyl carrier protein